MRGWQNRRTARSDRWKRENDAPRLESEVQHLETLRMNLEEYSGGHSVAGTNRIQHVVVARASARFEIPCGDSKCEEGGHDVTPEILSHLRAKRPEFEGSSVCNGHVGDRPCERQLKYSARATYKT
jgi:hypothetical protein